MRRPEFLARQARCPSGPLGRILARIMALETAPENVVTLEHLELQRADRVLEIAFGHGATLARAAAAVPDGFTTGVDISRAMVQFAGSRNQPLIESGRMRLKLGDSAALPHPDSCFDKAFAVHVLYFWEDPAPHLLEVRRVFADMLLP